MLPLLEGGVSYINYLKFFCMGDLSPPPFIYLRYHLFISVWTHEYLFHTWVILWVIMQYYSVLFCCSNSSSFGH